MAKFPDILCPTVYIESVPMLDVAQLKRQGIHVILTDLDNTLVPWRGSDLSPEVRAWVADALGQGMKFCIVSNTRNMKRLRNLSSELGIPYVKKGMKPRRSGFRAALELLGSVPSQAVVLGDQVFTDVLGGNRLGVMTILVRPLHPREFFGTKISRFFERIILRLFAQRGMLRCQQAEAGSPGEHLAETNSQKESEH